MSTPFKHGVKHEKRVAEKVLLKQRLVERNGCSGSCVIFVFSGITFRNNKRGM